MNLYFSMQGGTLAVISRVYIITPLYSTYRGDMTPVTHVEGQFIEVITSRAPPCGGIRKTNHPTKQTNPRFWRGFTHTVDGRNPAPLDM